MLNIPEFLEQGILKNVDKQVNSVILIGPLTLRRAFFASFFLFPANVHQHPIMGKQRAIADNSGDTTS